MAEADRKRVRVWASGRVQGVFFRQEASRTARAHGVGGWVRNLPDGRVEAVFEGPAPAVDSVVAWVRRGPPSAMVRAVALVEEQPQGEDVFRILS